MFRTIRIFWLSLILVSNGISLFGTNRDLSSVPFEETTVYSFEKYDNGPVDGLLQIDFNFPETVGAGEIFIFETVIKKQSLHSIGGKFQFTWPQGFLPMLPEPQNAKYTVDNNKMIIEWGAQSFPDDVKVAYPVKVTHAVSGVYPVLSVLTIVGGLQIIKNTKIRVDINKVGILPNHTIKATIGTYSLVLDYPREVEFNSFYNLDIILRKENTGEKATLLISVPPHSDVQVLNHEDFEYERVLGKLKLNWEKLPEASDITINCKLISPGNVKAVYPISAEFWVVDKLKAVFSNSIYLTEKAVVTKPKSIEKNTAESVKAKSDSIKLYAQMDELLNQWKNATKVITIETGKANITQDTKETGTQKKVEPEPAKKQDQQVAKTQITEVVKKSEPEIAKKSEPDISKVSDQVTEKKPELKVNKVDENKNEQIAKEQKQQPNTQNAVVVPVTTNAENTQNGQITIEKPTQHDGTNGALKIYRVQIAASKIPEPGIKQFIQSLGFFDTVAEDFDGTWYRYFVGEFNQISDAKEFNKQLIDKGITDSFVVTFIDGKKVPNN